MKSTGIVRKIDNLGRVVLPIELRRIFDIDKEDPVEIFVDDNYIFLKKYQPACIFCNDARDVVNFKGKNICKNCLAEMKNNH
ncbi:MAG: AbrB/MazE/SpoVT family DNA-binding domain-containing protein [Oscillospiraceae bacterium]